MDKNTIIGFVLIAAVLFGYSWFTKPTPEQLQELQRRNDSIAQVEQKKLEEIQQSQMVAGNADSTITVLNEDSLRQVQMKEAFGIFSDFTTGENEKINLKNDLVSLSFSSKGGALTEATLNKYKTHDSLPLTLFDEKDNEYGFIFKTGGRIVNTTDLFFKPIAGKDGKSVTMRLDFGNGKFFDLVYTLPEDSYMVKMDIRQKGMETILPGNTASLDLFWNQNLRSQEKGRMFEERNSALYYKFVGSDVDHLSESKDDRRPFQLGLKWIGYKNQFFSSALIPDGKFNGALIRSGMNNDPAYLKNFHTETTVDYNPADNNGPGFRFYLGPNLYPLLHSYDKGVDDDKALDLDKLVPLGFKFFRWINTWIIIPIFTFLGKYIANYGIIILLMTIIIKIFLAPLTFKSYMSSARMRSIASSDRRNKRQISGTRQSYRSSKSDNGLVQQSRNQSDERMFAYVIADADFISNVCILPFSSIELRQQSFLWAQDLSSYDAIFSWDAYIPLITPYFGNHISLFCLLMTITNILYTKINMDNTGGKPANAGYESHDVSHALNVLVHFQ